MKKIFINILLVLSAFFTFSIVVNAEKAKAPTTVPDVNSVVYATTDKTAGYDGFDFSKISFSSGSETLTGKTNLYKIKLASSYVSLDGTKQLSESWFTAYCLNPNLKNPINGIARRITSSTSEMNKLKFDSAVLAALYNGINSTQMYNLFSKLNQYAMEPENAVQYTIPSEYSSSSNPYKDMIDAVIAGTDVKIKFTSYTRTDGTNNVVLTASEINEVLGTTGDEYEVTLTADNIFFDQYKTTNLGSNVNYNRVLWIIEHSYPTLPLDRLYADAGVNKNTLESQLLALDGNTSLTDEEKIDGYIYSTVQYAIWKVLGVKVEGKNIGNQLVGSSELNKIYQYLIKDNGGYDAYGSKTFTSSLTVTRPSTADEIAEQTKDTIKYGPYSLKSGTLVPGTISLSLNSDKGVKVINESNEEITSVAENEKFYILVNKKEIAETIVLTATSTGAYTFEPQTNRGRVYYSVNPLTQNVISGGIVKAVSTDTTIEILVNPKTGIPSLALVFIVTLCLFSIGYVLIIKFNKPIKL